MTLWGTAIPRDTSIPERRKRRTAAEMREAREIEYRARQLRENAQHVADMDARGDRHGVCYFYGCAEGLVKIGFSTNLWSRISGISHQVPYKCEVLAVAGGGRSRESYYHMKFRQHAEFGEWFRRTPEVDAEIERLAATPLSRAYLDEATPRHPDKGEG